MQHLDLKIDEKQKTTVEWKWVILAMKAEWKMGVFSLRHLIVEVGPNSCTQQLNKDVFVVSLLGHVTFLSFRSMSSFFDSEVAFALEVNL